MEETTLPLEGSSAQGLSQEQTTSLDEICQHLEDKRAARGKHEDLAGLLMVLVLATLAGMKRVLGASDWVNDQEERRREHVKLPWRQMPCANPSTYALARLESQHVTACFREWLVRNEAQSRCGSELSRLAGQTDQRAVHLASDGKVLKGTGKQVDGGEKPQTHVFPVYEVHTGMVLHHCPILEKQNEVSALTLRLTEALCHGRLLTADAAQRSHEVGKLVTRAGGEVMLIITDQTPATRADGALFCEDPQADRSTWDSYEQIEKGHGRIERRQLLTPPDLNEYLDREWGDSGHVFRVQRERKTVENTTVDVVDGLTTLSRQQCSPPRLFPLIRDHWAIGAIHFAEMSEKLRDGEQGGERP